MRKSLLILFILFVLAFRSFAALDPIGGTFATCITTTVTLTNTTSGGVWNSGNASIATVDASSGVLTGVSSGTALISYTVGTDLVTQAVTVYSTPSTLSSLDKVCISSTKLLTNPTSGGTWYSSDKNIVGVVDTVYSSFTSHFALGIASGGATLFYATPTQCYTTTITVPTGGLGSIGVSGGYGAHVCEGSRITLTPPVGGGTWSSNNTYVATINASTGEVLGEHTDKIHAGRQVYISYIKDNQCATTTFTVYPLVSFKYPTRTCVGGVVTYLQDTVGGIWKSDNQGILSIDSVTGVATAVSAGITHVTYTLYGNTPPANCLLDRATSGSIFIDTPAVLSGPDNVCVGNTITITSSFSGAHTWNSSNTSVATVNSSGIVYGVSVGTALISYKISDSSCYSTKEVTVNPLPATITGTLTVCEGQTTTLASTTTGGSWNSSNISVATIDPTSGVVTGLSSGTCVITYTLPTGCYVTAIVTVYAAPSNITGTLTVCVGQTTILSSSPSGGTWTSSNTSVATVGSSTGVVTGVAVGTADITYQLSTGCYTYVTITVNPLPATITGTLTVCEGQTTTLSCATSGGTWSSSNTSVATIGSASGIVTGVAAGTSIVTYMLLTGCYANATVTVYAMPTDITGTLTVCVGQTTTLSSASSGGTWTSSNTSVATVGSSTGVVTGIASGTAKITYTLAGGCYKYVTVTVNPLPNNITGTLTLYCSQTTTLACTTSGGTWSSSNTSVATVGTSGIVTGVSPGTAAISYTLSTGCYKAVVVTVNVPVINGTPAMCVGATVTLTGTPSGGTWSSTDASIASIGSSSGVVTGSSAGTAVISYTKTSTCYATKVATVGATFNVTVCELEPIATCDDVISYCTNLKLSVSGGNSSSGYSWSPSIPATKTMSGDDAIYTFTAAPTAGTYTVTVTKDGCSQKKSIQIIVAPPGCYPCDFFKPCGTCPSRPFKTITAATLTSAEISTDTAGFYYIPKRTTTTVTTLNVSPARGSVLFMGDDVTLKVYNAIVLDSVHLFSSTSCAWSGISIVNTTTASGRLTIKGNTLIEHASVAAVEVNGPTSGTAYKPSGYVIESNHAIFNLNKVGIKIYSYVLANPDTVYPFLVESSVFTNRDFCVASEDCNTVYPFGWPTASYLKSPQSTEAGYNPLFNIDNYAGSTHADYGGISIVTAGHTDSFGVASYSYHSIVIGDADTLDNTNMFDSLGIGVGVTNGNATLYNNIFRRTPFFNPVNGAPYSGTAGVYGSLSYVDFVGKKRSIELLPGSLSRTNNRFYNCHHGFFGDCWYTFVSRKSEMYSTLITTGSDVSDMNYGIKIGNTTTSRHFGKHIIEGNKMGNLRRGIFENLESCYNPNGVVKITANTIADTIPYTASEYGGFGINILERGSCSSVGASLRIDSNMVKGYLLGIYVAGDNSPTVYASFNTVIDNDTIVLRNGLSSNVSTRKGIICYYAKYVSDVTNNYVYGDTLHGVDYNSPSPGSVPTPDSHVGIELQKTSNTSTAHTNLSCNYVHDVASGFRFIENNVVDWRNNVMLRNTYGMVLYYANSTGGSIGDQSDSCHPMDNVWYDGVSGANGWPGWLGTNVYETYSVSSDPTYSRLFVRNDTSGPYRFKPTINDRKLYTTPSGTAYSLGTTVIDVSSHCEIASPTMCAPTFNGSFGEGGARPGVDGNNGTVLSDATGSYTLYPNPSDGNIIITQNIPLDVIVKLRVLNYSGASVYNSNQWFNNGTTNLNIGNVAPGIYIVLLTDEKGNTASFRVVVQ